MGRFIFIILFSAVILCSANAAIADPGHGRGHGHGKHWKHHDHDRDWDDEDHVVITRIDEPDRVIIRRYYVDSCPPGLRKKHNGCVPPGHAKRHYVVGRPLPEYVVYEPAPTVLVQQLQPVPVGYQYVVVDNDVLLISAATKMVIDAIGR